METFKALIVDDENKARSGLKSLLSVDQSIEIVGECKDGIEAIEFFENSTCDLLLLDIQMPGIDGFDVLNTIDNPPLTIFITAFDEYALKAFEYHAQDYLLKPFTNDRFYQSINRAKATLLTNNPKLDLNRLVDYLREQRGETSLLHSSTKDQKRLIVKDSGKVILLDLDGIESITSDDYYIKIHHTKGTYMIRESLKSILERLPEKHFIRIHNSTIINTDYIDQFEHLQNAEYLITMKSQSKVKVSRSYRKAFDEFLEKL